MHIPDCSTGSVEVEHGGFADVSQGTYQGCQVAIKVVRVYATSDLDVILSVSLLSSTCTARPEWISSPYGSCYKSMEFLHERSCIDSTRFVVP